MDLATTAEPSFALTRKSVQAKEALCTSRERIIESSMVFFILLLLYRKYF
jgi:hypothetical protein